MQTPEPTPAELLISEAFAKRAQIDAALVEFEALEARILALGKGKHTGAQPGQAVTVVAAAPAKPGTPSYALEVEKEAKARELAGEAFPKLFVRQVIYSPVEAFPAVAHALLTPARERDLVKLCEKPGKPFNGKAAYILWKG